MMHTERKPWIHIVGGLLILLALGEVIWGASNSLSVESSRIAIVAKAK